MSVNRHRMKISAGHDKILLVLSGRPTFFTKTEHCAASAITKQDCRRLKIAIVLATVRLCF